MKAYKVTLLILDDEGMEPDEITQTLENQRYQNRRLSPEVLSIYGAEVEDWSDDHPLNQQPGPRRRMCINRLFRHAGKVRPAPPVLDEVHYRGTAWLHRLAGGEGCGRCWDCLDDPAMGWKNPTMRQFIVCPECGNKRCPHATNHNNACTDSNEPNQPGSRYGGLPRGEE